MLTVNPFSRPGQKLQEVKGVVIHWVANPGTSAQANRNYFESLKRQKKKDGARYASAHFIIGITGDVLQCLPIDEVAYHVGAWKYRDGIEYRLSSYPNNCTIGIELCHKNWTGAFTEETLASAIVLTATLLKQFSLNPQTDLYRHFDITGKDCPRYFIGNLGAWIDFKCAVEKYLISIL